MEPISIIGAASVLAAGFCISVGGISASLGEGRVAASAMTAIAQQPDEANTITRTLFVSMAMIESCAIYSFVITILIMYFNPFWNFAVELMGK